MQAGALVACIGQPGETPPVAAGESQPAEAQTTQPRERGRSSARLSPVVARIAAECNIEKRAVVITQNGVDALAIKPMAYLSLSFDHRILDGAGADCFMATLKQALEQWSER